MGTDVPAHVDRARYLASMPPAVSSPYFTQTPRGAFMRSRMRYSFFLPTTEFQRSVDDMQTVGIWVGVGL